MLDAPYLKGEGAGGPQFHFLTLPHKREHGTINGIPGVSPLPQFHFEGGGDSLWSFATGTSACMASVAVCSPAKRLTSSGLMENPLVGKQFKSSHPTYPVLSCPVLSAACMYFNSIPAGPRTW